jgi:hypothetical protein
MQLAQHDSNTTLTHPPHPTSQPNQIATNQSNIKYTPVQYSLGIMNSDPTTINTTITNVSESSRSTKSSNQSAQSTQSNSSINNSINSINSNNIKMELAIFVSIKAKLKASNIPVSLETLMDVVRCTMEAIELSELKGEKQKKMAIRLVSRLIREAPIPSNHKEKCMSILTSGVINQAIDIIINTSQGKYIFNKATTLIDQTSSKCDCCVIQ